MSLRGVFAAMLAAALGALVFGCTSALAAAPETPSLEVTGSKTFTSLVAPPTIESESVTGISSNSVELAAEVNPGGAETTYHFEYGTTEAYGHSTLESESIGSDEAGHAVAVHIQELQPATTYHYRVVATNPQSPAGGMLGPDQTFTTQTPSEALTLPDGRQWELVSPPVKEGGRIVPIEEESFVQAADGGDAVTYTSFLAPTEPGSAGFSQGSQVFSSRAAGGGWSSRDINAPHEEQLGIVTANGGEYKLFSSDLALGIIEPWGNGRPPLSPRATERTPYVRDDAPVAPSAGEQGVYDQAEAEAPVGSRNGYLPLVSPADVPPGTVFGERFPSGVHFEGASPDLSHVVLKSPVPLTAKAAAARLGEGLYEWSGGRLQLVSVLPGANGEPAPGVVGEGGEIVRNAISTDGSRVYWTDGHLYMRDTTTEVTVQVDAAQPGVPEPEQAAAEFKFASSDGSKVFFTDTQKLTRDSTASGPDLYECEVIEAAGQLVCALSDLTVEPHGGEGADVQGSLLGASENGSYVYFIAAGLLAEGATTRGNNVYVLHDSDGVWTTRFIAKLSEDDYPDWTEQLPQMPARVSPNGEYMALMSDSSLTGYDNIDVDETPTTAEVEAGVSPLAKVKRSDEEVYLYHAEVAKSGQLEPGQLICASCDPSGARPVGIEAAGAADGEQPINEQEIWPGGRWLAADVPGWVGAEGHRAPRSQPRYLSDSGRLFFNGVDPLVPQAANGVADVYEYEPVEDGGCAASSSTFDTASDGCLALISAGSSGEESVFLGASESGNDVFFLTGARLAPQDLDTSSDVYDAHVCSAAEPCSVGTVSPPACTTADACRAAPTPQPAIFGAPSSATFSGAGNFVPPPSVALEPKPKSKPSACKQGFIKKKGKCVKKPKAKKQGKHSAKRSTSGRGNK